MKNKIKLMMIFMLLFQIVQPVISGVYVYAQEVKESIEYEKDMKVRNALMRKNQLKLS